MNMKDWLNDTLKYAKENSKVYWIIKRHPLENWYRSGKIENIIEGDLPSHIKIIPDGWSGNSILNNIDGVVTFYGTVGIEAAAKGKIVLTGTKGWYSSSGFSIFPKNKIEYFNF